MAENTDEKLIQKIIENVKENERLEKAFRERIGSCGKEIIPTLVKFLKNNRSQDAERLLQFIALGMQKSRINGYMLESRLFHYAGEKTKKTIMKRMYNYYFPKGG